MFMEYKIAFNVYAISRVFHFDEILSLATREKNSKLSHFNSNNLRICETLSSSRAIRFYVTGIRLRQINEPKTFYASNARITIGYLSFAPICECGHVARVITNCWTSFEQLPHALEIFSMESRLSITAHYETALPFPPSPLRSSFPSLNPF